MKSSKVPHVLERNPMRGDRKPGERLPVVTFEEFDEVVPAPAPRERDWREAPGMPYDDGLKDARPGMAIEWTPERKEQLKQAQARGDKVRVAQLMKQWSE